MADSDSRTSRPKRPAPPTAFKPGQSGNPGGRRRVDPHVVELARTHTEAALQALSEVLAKPEAKDADRIAAAEALLNRGWGRAPEHISQEITGAQGAPLSVTVADLMAASRKPT